MHTLFDLEETVEAVDIKGKQIGVCGVNLDGVFYIVEKFPEVKGVMGQKVSDINAEVIAGLVPQALAFICAVGTTSQSSFDTSKDWKEAVDKVFKKAKGLAIGEQVKLLAKILEVSMPDGKDPFFAQLKQVTGVFSGANVQPVGSSEELSQASLVTVDGGATPKHLRRVG